MRNLIISKQDMKRSFGFCNRLNMAMEDDFEDVFLIENEGFSIAMLVDQRVFKSTYILTHAADDFLIGLSYV